MKPGFYENTVTWHWKKVTLGGCTISNVVVLLVISCSAPQQLLFKNLNARAMHFLGSAFLWGAQISSPELAYFSPIRALRPQAQCWNVEDASIPWGSHLKVRKTLKNHTRATSRPVLSSRMRPKQKNGSKWFIGGVLDRRFEAKTPVSGFRVRHWSERPELGP